MIKIKPRNEGIDEELFNRILSINDNVPAYKDIGGIITHLGPGKIRLSVQIKPQFQNYHGTAHGGVLANLIDIGTGMAVFTLGMGVITLEMNLNYFSSGKVGENIVIEGRVIHSGKTIAVSEAEIFNSNNTLMAKGRGTFIVTNELADKSS